MKKLDSKILMELYIVCKPCFLQFQVKLKVKARADLLWVGTSESVDSALSCQQKQMSMRESKNFSTVHNSVAKSSVHGLGIFVFPLYDAFLPIWYKLCSCYVPYFSPVTLEMVVSLDLFILYLQYYIESQFSPTISPLICVQ